ncbi:MAG: nucleotidyl transferase AbiEii/AbiGii toxin family protein, partial [Bacteroidota bacterium]
PNQPIDIASWVMDFVKSSEGSFDYMDNTAKAILCYLPGYTLVEKIQTIVNKFRKESGNNKSK